MTDAADEPRTDIARRVFDYWKRTLKHPRAHIDDKRMNLICTRLKDGYTEEDLKLAIFGCSISPWHQGQNPSRSKYDSVELIFRGGDKVDLFIALGEERQLAMARIKEQEQIETEERLKASVPGEAYKSVKSNLLKLVKRNDE